MITTNRAISDKKGDDDGHSSGSDSDDDKNTNTNSSLIKVGYLIFFFALMFRSSKYPGLWFGCGVYASMVLLVKFVWCVMCLDAQVLLGFACPLRYAVVQAS